MANGDRIQNQLQDLIEKAPTITKVSQLGGFVTTLIMCISDNRDQVMASKATTQKLNTLMLGENGRDGVLQRLSNVEEKVDRIPSMQTDLGTIQGQNKLILQLLGHDESAKDDTKNGKSGTDSFKKVVVWFVDKILPGLVIAIITAASTLMLATYLHIFGA